MITIEKTPDTVLALRLIDKLDAGDIATLKTAFDKKLANQKRFGLVIDITRWDDITEEAIAADIPFELGLVSEISRFPRVAIVSDKAFVRALEHFAKAIVPSMTVKRFASDAFEAAVAFAAEVSPEANPGMPGIALIDTGSDVLAFDIVGMVDVADIDRLAGPALAAFEKPGKIDMLARVSNFKGFSPAILMHKDFLSIKMEGLANVRRYAIVGGPAWIAKLATTAGQMSGIDIKTFNLAEEAQALAWLNR